VVPSAAQVREFLAALNAAVPGLDATSADVVRFCSGLLPAAARHPARPAARPLIHDHGSRGGPRGLYSVSGVKYTTARAVAEEVLQAISRGLGRALPAANRARPAPAAYELALDQPPGPLSWRASGRAAELARLATEEAVIHLDDLVLRRTDWWAFPDQLPHLAAEVGEALGWEPARRELELERLRAALAPVPGDGHDAPRPRTALAAF
jgi:glycerol-3-phosphate dehydrogenase